MHFEKMLEFFTNVIMLPTDGALLSPLNSRRLNLSVSWLVEMRCKAFNFRYMARPTNHEYVDPVCLTQIHGLLILTKSLPILAFSDVEAFFSTPKSINNWAGECSFSPLNKAFASIDRSPTCYFFRLRSSI